MFPLHLWKEEVCAPLAETEPRSIPRCLYTRKCATVTETEPRSIPRCLYTRKCATVRRELIKDTKTNHRRYLRLPDDCTLFHLNRKPRILCTIWTHTYRWSLPGCLSVYQHYLWIYLNKSIILSQLLLSHTHTFMRAHTLTHIHRLAHRHTTQSHMQDLTHSPMRAHTQTHTHPCTHVH